MYTLIAKTSAFADTFNPAIESDFLIARSLDRARLEEIERLLLTKDNPTASSASRNSRTRIGLPSAEYRGPGLLLRPRDVVRPGPHSVFPIDRYYGPGSLDEFVIDGPPDDEFVYIPPTV
jgi:hypothetical protein